MATLAPKHLVVDDEPATRSLMTQVFAGIGFAVCAAEDGFAALSEIRLGTLILPSSICRVCLASSCYQSSAGAFRLLEGWQ
jgi:CheY-like chemotaxis protein